MQATRFLRTVNYFSRISLLHCPGLLTYMEN